MTLLVLLALACGIGRDLDAGHAALERGDLPTAEAAWRRALDRDPANADALYGIGWTWHLAGQKDAARGAFQQLVTLHPESPLGYKGLGSVALAEGNPGVARQRFEEALTRAPGDPAIRQSLALADLAAGDAATALPLFEALVAEDPGRIEAQTARAEALLALGREQEAVDAARAAVALDPGGRAEVVARITLARALVAATRDRVAPADCATTAPPIYAWLEEADRVLDEAEATGIRAPDLPETRRAVLRRRGAIDDLCPGVRTGMGN